MTTKRKIVVDASVARAAGDVSQHPVSAGCRSALTAILGSNLFVLTGRPLRDEWNKHQSRFSRLWLTSMVARGRFIYVTHEQTSLFRTCIKQNAPTAKCLAAMDKDAHLIELALAGDKRIVALDEVVRAHFRELSRYYPDLKKVLWANPTKTDDDAAEWLARNAPRERKLMLAG